MQNLEDKFYSHILAEIEWFLLKNKAIEWNVSKYQFKEYKIKVMNLDSNGTIAHSKRICCILIDNGECFKMKLEKSKEAQANSKYNEYKALKEYLNKLQIEFKNLSIITQELEEEIDLLVNWFEYKN